MKAERGRFELPVPFDTPVFKTELDSAERTAAESTSDFCRHPVGAHFGAQACLCASANDAELQAVVAAWADLPASIRRAISALVASQLLDVEELPPGGALC